MKTIITIKTLIKILEKTPQYQNIMLVGNHGIGKSEIISQFYKEKNKKVVTFFLGQMSDPGDLIGLMHKNEKNGMSEFLPPYWWPHDNQPIVLFLDELNRARPEILQSVMDLCLNKTLAGKKLPEGSIVISAINDGEIYQTTELDPALISRFNIYHFKPTTNEWLLWAAKNKIDKRIITFISNNKQYLDSEVSDDTSLEKTPDRRAWVKVSHLIENEKKISSEFLEIICGIIGVKTSIKFNLSLKRTFLTPAQLLLEFDKNIKKLKKMEITELSDLNSQICHFLEVDSEELMDSKKGIIVKNLEKYFKWLDTNKYNEIIAHLINELENPDFKTINEIIFINSDYCNNFISNFIVNTK